MSPTFHVTTLFMTPLTGEDGAALVLLVHLSARLPVARERRLVHEAPQVVVALEVRLPLARLPRVEIRRHVGDLDVGAARVQVPRVHLGDTRSESCHVYSAVAKTIKTRAIHGERRPCTYLAGVLDELHLVATVLLSVHGAQPLTDLRQRRDLGLLVDVLLPVLVLKVRLRTTQTRESMHGDYFQEQQPFVSCRRHRLPQMMS